MAESRIAEEKDRMKKQHSTAIDVVQQWRDKCESLDKVATGEQKKVKLLERKPIVTAVPAVHSEGLQ